METHTYLVTLQPLEPWFFGGEKMTELGNRTQFHQKSTLYPQQTALLGLLRHQVLLYHNLIGTNGKLREEAGDWIGETGFDVQNTMGYGHIESLGPVHLRIDQQPYFRCPWDVDWLWEEKRMAKVHFGEGEGTHLSLFAAQYSPKIAPTERLIGPGGAILPLDKVVKWLPQPGITKNKTGQRDAQGYYRQEYIWPAISQSLAFGFYAQLKGEWPTQPQTVLFGGQRSPFQIRYQRQEPEIPQSLSHQYRLPEGWHRITLLSPAYTPNDFARLADFAVNTTLSMRHIRTSVKQTRHYAGLKRHASEDSSIDTPTLSDRLTLQDRGSVFYFSSEANCEAATQALEAQTAFRNIGYNHYLKG